MKAAVIGRDFPPKLGGLADCTYWLAKTLSDHVSVDVIAQPAGGDHRREPFAFHPFTRWNWGGTAAFLRLLGRIGPDTVILNLNLYMFGRHGICFYLVCWMLIWKYAMRGRLIVNFIELYAEPARLKHRPISFLQKTQARILAHAADSSVASHAQYGDILREWLGRNGTVQVIPVGGNIPPVSMGEGERESLRTRLAVSATYLVGTFSNLCASPILIDALKTLRERGLSVAYVLIGDAQRLHAADWALLTREASRPDSGLVIGQTGFLDPKEVSKRLQCLDVYAYLDHRLMTKSGTVMAALEHGLPVVAFHDDALPAPFVHGENIVIAGPPDALALADTLERVLKDSDLRGKLAREGRALYEKEFDWPVIGGRFMKLLS
ncbi:MAG: glycosyltransferase family 4 protein [Nitrospirae bacterium]|nr:glycosyltransferase family 4 protein [Nitrospirota bacterium]